MEGAFGYSGGLAIQVVSTLLYVVLVGNASLSPKWLLLMLEFGSRSGYDEGGRLVPRREASTSRLA